jgi:hypothetical protein
MTLYVKTYDELKKVENFLFRFIYPEEFSLQIIIQDPRQISFLPDGKPTWMITECFNYKTVYNDLAQGLILETF